MASLTVAIETAITENFGFSVPVLLIAEQDLRKVLVSCPFPNEKGNLVHVFLCFETPKGDLGVIENLRAQTEQIAIVGNNFWLFAPEGIGRSKLAAKLDLGVEMTARNLNTLTKMVEMLDG